MGSLFQSKIITLTLVAIIIGLGPLAFTTSSFSDDIKNLERKLEYLKLRKSLDEKLKMIQHKIKSLEEKYNDVVNIKEVTQTVNKEEKEESTAPNVTAKYDPNTELNNEQILVLFKGNQMVI